MVENILIGDFGHEKGFNWVFWWFGGSVWQSWHPSDERMYSLCIPHSVYYPSGSGNSECRRRDRWPALADAQSMSDVDHPTCRGTRVANRVFDDQSQRGQIVAWPREVCGPNHNSRTSLQTVGLEPTRTSSRLQKRRVFPCEMEGHPSTV